MSGSGIRSTNKATATSEWSRRAPLQVRAVKLKKLNCFLDYTGLATRPSTQTGELTEASVASTCFLEPVEPVHDTPGHCR